MTLSDKRAPRDASDRTAVNRDEAAARPRQDEPPPVPRPITLYLPGGPENGGFVFVPLTGSQPTVDVELLPAKVRVLLALQKAMESDADLPASARGWRSPAAISEMVAAESQWSVPLEPQTVRSYVADIYRRVWERFQERFQEQFPDAAGREGRLDVSQLFERRRHFGIRLAQSLHVIDATARSDTEVHVDSIRPGRL